MSDARPPTGVPDTAPRSCFRYRNADHVPDPMPCRGIAYQPRVPTLGIHPKKQPRVLKERRIGRVLRTSAPPILQVSSFIPQSFYPVLPPRFSLCGVPSEHTDSLGCISQGDALGWYALPHSGQMGRRRFRNRNAPPRSRYGASIAFPLPDRPPRSRYGASIMSPIPERRPRLRSHALEGHRIPAQGTNPGNAPGNIFRILKERRIGRGLGPSPRPSFRPQVSADWEKLR
jgi:hypothetical protein